MPFPLSVSDVFKMFELAHDRKAENKKAISGWLDSVYGDLEDLSKVWFGMCEALETANEQQEIAKALKIIMRETRGSQDQQAFAGRLSHFYRSASSVLGSRGQTDFQIDFLDQLGKLLWERARARKILDEEIHDDREQTIGVLLRLREQAEAIQRQVVSLQVLITTFKAMR